MGGRGARRHEVPEMPTSDRLYFRQLLAGRDFARSARGAAEMVNFVYLIDDSETRECVVVDPAWSIRDLLAIVEKDGMKLTAALATHHHPDHVGGVLMGMAMVEGVQELLAACPVPVHCHREEAPWIRRSLGLESSDLAPVDSGDVIRVGGHQAAHDGRSREPFFYRKRASARVHGW